MLKYWPANTLVTTISIFQKLTLQTKNLNYCSNGTVVFFLLLLYTVLAVSQKITIQSSIAELIKLGYLFTVYWQHDKEL